MQTTLADICKELHVTGVYTYFTEYYPDNHELENVMVSALQAELDIRFLNRQMRTLKQAGFPTRKRFEELVADALPDDGRNAVAVLKSLDFIRERRNVIQIGNSGTGKTHLAIATGVLACEQNFRVSFRTAAS